MPRQDVDPLSDTLPPRYAYESDDEDETGLANSSSGTALDTSAVQITILPPIKDNKTEKEYGGVLIVASGAAGAVWARGAALGEQVGQVNVNKHTIGLVFHPTWAGQGGKGTVLVSEALARLPVWAMNAYAAAVLARWNPLRVILLDAYSTATYISAAPIAHHEAPLRYLSTDRAPPSSNTPLSLFAPPNLLQSTTAAFLNQLALPRPSGPKTSAGLAFLIPSRRVPLPTPQNLSRADDDSEPNVNEGLASLARLEDAEDWDPAVLRAAHGAVREAFGPGGPGDEWADSRGIGSEKGEEVRTTRRKAAQAEGGMYI